MQNVARTQKQHTDGHQDLDTESAQWAIGQWTTTPSPLASQERNTASQKKQQILLAYLGLALLGGGALTFVNVKHDFQQVRRRGGLGPNIIQVLLLDLPATFPLGKG